MMGHGRAEALAARFEEANGEAIAVLRQVPDQHWDRVCPDEGWPVGTTAHHIAIAYPVHMRIFGAIAEGRPLHPLSWSQIEHINARHAERHAACTREEAVELLAGNGEAVAGRLRELGDDQLDRSGSFLSDMPPLSVQQWIELVLIGHVHMHLGSIRAAAGV